MYAGPVNKPLPAWELAERERLAGEWREMEAAEELPEFRIVAHPNAGDDLYDPADERLRQDIAWGEECAFDDLGAL